MNNPIDCNLNGIEALKQLEFAKKYLRLSITEKCNLNCYYCHKEGVSKTIQRNRFGNDKKIKIKKIMKTASCYSFHKLKFVGGEVFCCYNAVEIFNYSIGLFKDVGVTTNGVLIENFKNELKTLDPNFTFNVSLNTLLTEKYFQITGHDALKSALKGIDIIKSNAFKIKINMLVRKDNFNEIDDMLRFAKCLDANIKFLDLVDSTSNEFVSIETIYNYLKSNYHVIKQSNNLGYYIIKVNNTNVELPLRLYTQLCQTCHLFPCAEGISSIRAFANGTVMPCFNYCVGVATSIKDFAKLIVKSRHYYDYVFNFGRGHLDKQFAGKGKAGQAESAD